MKKKIGFALLTVVALSTTSLAFAATTTYYRLASSPASLRSYDVFQPPHAFHIKAVVDGSGSVKWAEKVEGRGKLCADGKDILDLGTGTAHSAADGAKPTGPYVLGCKSGAVFTPSSLEVQNP